ncbi:hypothetical protein OAH23_00915 [Verrucomicrobia bacterium]|nr:hypothetical protein [Verrucomicrobiota bacterium]
MKPDWVLTIEAWLSEWETHTIEEESAIQSQDWQKLSSLHASKEELMQSIQATLDKEEDAEAGLKRWLAPQMADLFAMEKKNAELLAIKQNYAKGEIDKSRSSGRQLNKIKSAYTADKDSVMLTSYS